MVEQENVREHDHVTQEDRIIARNYFLATRLGSEDDPHGFFRIEGRPEITAQEVLWALILVGREILCESYLWEFIHRKFPLGEIRMLRPALQIYDSQQGYARLNAQMAAAWVVKERPAPEINACVVCGQTQCENVAKGWLNVKKERYSAPVRDVVCPKCTLALPLRERWNLKDKFPELVFLSNLDNGAANPQAGEAIERIA